jgi:hypothetical protein
VDYAGLALDEDDWQPFGIFSSIEPGVRRGMTPNGPAIEISFLRALDGGLTPPT